MERAYVLRPGSDKTVYVVLGKGGITVELVDDWKGRSVWVTLTKQEVQELVELLGKWLKGELEEVRAQ